ncbi:uncharacterized protein LOC124920691 [Impatiens glandulifera]|uniref:uncharacterized protein LOC124920691 n=1 Tax=Impatiens glandulifera TaxID=253017 RepID=UPI001FB0DC3F|nr:uncharacterized protein LOC124920691 [Impatiens glandulifera]
MNNNNRSDILLPSSSSSSSSLRRPISQSQSQTKTRPFPLSFSNATNPSRFIKPSPSSFTTTTANNRLKQQDFNGESGLIATRPKSAPRHTSSIRNLPAEEINKPRTRRVVSTVNKSFVSHKKPGGGEEEEETLVNVDKSEALIRDLQSQVLQLKAELEQAHNLNAELQSHNEKLSRDLATAAAEAKVASATNAIASTHDNKETHNQNTRFKDIQKMIADKLQRPIVKFDAANDSSQIKRSEPKQPILLPINAPRNSLLPPPPPPPLPVRPTIRPSTNKVELISADRRLKHTVNKPETSSSVHNSIVGEIQRRSSHLLAIKADVEAKGELINNLIKKIHDAAYSDIKEVVKFVDWFDGELSSLADERAVLKHFKWPESKADALREAAVEYRCLDLIHEEISSYKDDNSIVCVVSLKKMASLLDKSEQSIQRLIKLRKNALITYQQFKIPIDWMLDTGIISKIKVASGRLAKIYMKRVLTEFESDHRGGRREFTQEGLLIQGVDFAYRAQQFAGGLDSETLCVFEEMRRHVPGRLRGNAELLAS